MALTRLGYVIILVIIGGAAVAIAFVVLDFGGSSGAKSPVALPEMPFERVLDYARYGAVTSIDATGADLTVHLREDVDTTGLNTTSHTFRSTVPAGQTVTQAIEAAGFRVNGPDGLPVVTH